MNQQIDKTAALPGWDERLLEQIACPACRGELKPGPEQMVCAGCGRAYPIVDGIPVLIAERAIVSE